MNTNTALQVLIEKYRNYENFSKLDLNNINCQFDPDGDALIHLVTRFGTPEEIKMLVKSGANLNATGYIGFTPLHYAAINIEKCVDAAKQLLALGADKTIRDEYDDTPLDIARSFSWQEMIDILTTEDPPSFNLSLQAVVDKYQSYIDYAELDLSDINRQFCPDDDTLIHLVVRVGTLEEIKLLMKSGAKVNAPGDLGYTPLHYAALSGRMDMAELLLTFGADALIRDEYGDIPADVARSMGYTEVFDLLNRAHPLP